jgi:hypothetical protein
MSGLRVVKTHALGNDFLLLDGTELPENADRPALARVLCERRRGLGADGLILYKGTNALESAFGASRRGWRSGRMRPPAYRLTSIPRRG